MTNFLKRWFAPPIFPADEEKTRRAALLHLILTISMCYLAVMIPVLVLQGNSFRKLALINAAVFLLTAFLRSLLPRGKVNFVGIASITVTFIWILATGLIQGTIRTPATTVYLFVVMLSGALFGWAGIVIASAASSLAVFGLIAAENAGLLPEPNYAVSFIQWLTYTAIFIVTGGLGFHINQSMMGSLERAKKEIAERKRVELELRKLARAVEQSPASIVIADLNANIEYVNPRFTQVTGYKLDEVAGKNPRVLKTEFTALGTHFHLWDALIAGREWRGEFVNRKKDGSLYFESAIISPITDADGIATHYLAVKEDVTERRNIEEALRQSEERLELFFSQSLDGFFFMMLDEPVYWNDTVDKEHALDYIFTHQRITKINDSMLAQYKAAREQFVGLTPSDFFAHDILQGRQVWRKFLDDGRLHVDTEERKFDGSPMWVEGDYICTYDPRGRITGHFGIQREVTDRKQAQEKLRQQNEYLSILHQVTLDLLNRRNMDELLQAVVDRAVTLLDAPFGELMLEENGELVVQTATQNQTIVKGERVRRGEARLSWQAFDTKQPAVLEDYAAYPHRRDIYTTSEIHAVADFPVLVRDTCIGVLAVGRSQPGYVFSKTQIENGVLFAQLVALVLDSAQILSAANHEIDERTRAEDALRESHAKQQALFENARDAIVIADPEIGIILDVNSQAGILFGLSKEQLVGKHQADLHPQEKAAELEKRFKDHAQGSRNLVETEIVTAHGDLIPVEISASAVQLPNEKWVLQGIFRDVTVRKQFEDHLRASEAQFRALFEQSHDAVFLLDFQGKHLAVNQRAADMLGYSKEEIQPLSMSDLSAEVKSSERVFERLLNGEQIPLYERLFRKKNGEIFPVEINVEIVRDTQGNPMHIQSVVRDITQRKGIETALKETNEQLLLRVGEIEKLHEELREQALHDPLTGLYNRRYLNETLDRSLARMKREQKPLSVIIMDIDHFKKVNDTYGHQVGDQILVEVAKLIASRAREYDFACRYGGEEFLLVMPGAAPADALKRAEEIRRKCMEISVRHEGKDLSVTLSLGVAAYPQHGKTADEVLTKADNTLYISKRSGRNTVTLWKD